MSEPFIEAVNTQVNAQRCEQVTELVAELAQLAVQQRCSLATAESCTGGGISTAMTAIAGSSAWFDAGFVTYSNQAKQRMLNVPLMILEQHGAVSKAVVSAMTQGALDNSQAGYSVAVSGVAGPGGGSPEKPVGTVWIAWRSKQRLETQCFNFDGDREAVRQQTIVQALQGLIKMLKG